MVPQHTIELHLYVTGDGEQEVGRHALEKQKTEVADEQHHCCSPGTSTSSMYVLLPFRVLELLLNPLHSQQTLFGDVDHPSRPPRSRRPCDREAGERHARLNSRYRIVWAPGVHP